MRSLSCEREGRLSTSGTEGREGAGRTASPAARGPASRFPVPAWGQQGRGSDSGRAGTMPNSTPGVGNSPPRRGAPPHPAGAPLTPGCRAHRANAPPRCCHPPSAAVRRWAPSWPGCGTGSRSPRSVSPSPRASPPPSCPGGRGSLRRAAVVAALARSAVPGPAWRGRH